MHAHERIDFPRVSIVLLAYNQAGLVLEAARSCLAQDCPPIEIVMSDDASGDDTHVRLLAAAAGYNGPHQVIVRRNERNLGIGEHYNLLLQIASGDLIVTSAGDDISTPDRVRRLVDAWDANGRSADLIASHVIDMDREGRLHDLIRVDDLSPYKTVDDWLRKRPYVIGAGHAFTRRMMDRFGPMLPGIAYEDQIMAFRAILGGGAITVNLPLVHYRRGGASARPSGDSSDDAMRWNTLQLVPMLAEMRQLVADALTAGCGPAIESHFEVPIQDRAFALGMLRSQHLADRWRALLAAPAVPLGWRLRKLLQVSFPRAATSIRRASKALKRHRRRASR